MHNVALTFNRLALLWLGLSGTQLVGDDRLDVDANQPGRQILHICKLDGSPIRPLIKDVELRHRFDRQGTPDASARAGKIAFDAWPSKDGFAWQESRIIVCDADGSDAMDVSDGVMPCFSPSGDQLAVSRPPKYAKKDGAVGQSIWIMNSDGSEMTMIADRGAWGARWTGDGKSLVFHGGHDDEGNALQKNCLRVYDLTTETFRDAFTAEESPFSRLSFHFDCSSKGSLVAFGGTLKDGDEGLAIIDVDKGIESLKLITNEDETTRVLYGFSTDWHPRCDRLLVIAFRGRALVPLVLPLNPLAEVNEVDAQEGISAVDTIYSADGKNLISALRSR